MRWVACLLCVLGCDEATSPESAPAPLDGGPLAPPPATACVRDVWPIIEPVWIAGGPGPREATGAFGKPDAVLLDPDGLLLAGDEHEAYEEIHVFDARTEDPDTTGEPIEALVDWGADPGPGGDGQMEFRGVSGFARDRETGHVYVAEQGNARVQVLRPAGPVRAPPYYVHEGYVGGPAADPDRPRDGEFVRLQALRTDALGRLFASDDAKRNATSARRDVQVFDRDGAFLYAFGAGHLQEPENFVIDAVRDRIYVCDEGAAELVVFGYTDPGPLRRVGGFSGEPNGVDIDQFGYVYTVDQADPDGAHIRVLEPDGLAEVFRFGRYSGSPRPGFFKSPDTLIVDVEQDLVVLADQGHGRIQAFRLSEIQARACVRTLRVAGPPRALSGSTLTLRVEALGPDGELDRSRPRRPAIARAGGRDHAFTLFGGVGSVTLPITGDGPLDVEVQTDALRALHTVDRLEAPASRALSGRLQGEELHWRQGDIVSIDDSVEVPAGATLEIEPDVLVALGEGARLEVKGALHARGSEGAPIYFFARDPAKGWGQIDHHPGAGDAVYTNVFLAHGANASWTRNDELRHCCAYQIRFRGERLEMSRTVVADAPGKGLLSFDAAVLVRGALFQRLGHGVELIHGTGTITDSVFAELRGTDDNDGVYLGAKDAPGDFTLARIWVADVDDDGIDTENSSPIATDVVVHDVEDKGLSLTGGSPVFTNCLVFGARMGAKIDDKFKTAASVPEFHHCTFVDNDEFGFLASTQNEHNADADIRPRFFRSVVWGNGAGVETEFDPDTVRIEASLVEGTTEGVVVESAYEGTPVFLEPGRRDYRLHPLSPGASPELTIGFRGFQRESRPDPVARADLVVNEVVATSPDGPDWVELKNTGPRPVSLEGWMLTDKRPDTHRHPLSGAIAPGQHLVVRRGVGGFDFGLGPGDAARLYDPTGQLVDSLEWADGQAPAGSSFGRSPDGTGPGRTLRPPTPGAANP